MKFNFTKGKTAKYMVMITSWNISDIIYYHYYREAKEMFDELLKREWESDTVISIYDMKDDVRKEFAKIKK